ncbi:5'-nucleotidase [Terasakiispira papahanaumokuakeensis]|uniref:5'-nucleotidase n=1 Tax=Terasakiispira papahanaumokuakeensis TaxID=197479 RepID=A0A1E2V7Z7_9GAMM|nr:HAD family acid phosphatase [Terasakiispira papahanaumokuakeensis]ODC03140.1 5'-nucleotidase [Terasakiispira papahanaumokuakeensis]
MPSACQTTIRRLALATLLLAPTAFAESPTQICEQKAYEMGLRYQQQSAEVAALQRQGFTLAHYRLKDQLDQFNGDPASLAIITDLDETVIDNSALLVRDMQACHDYTTWDTWSHWEKNGHPRLIPGAKAFFDYANQAGVSIYYISDRFGENKASTIATLKALELPQVSEDHVLLYGTPKAERRNSVTQHHTLIMQLGDSLHDFSKVFAEANLAEQQEAVKANADHFGQDWIVFPNSTYGDWSEAKLNAWDAPLNPQ